MACWSGGRCQRQQGNKTTASFIYFVDPDVILADFNVSESDICMWKAADERYFDADIGVTVTLRQAVEGVGLRSPHEA